MYKTSRFQFRAAAFSLACLVSAGHVQAISQEADLQWNGFFTGAFSQSDNKYPYGRFYSISDSGSYLTDTRLGLQASARVNDKVTLTTQLVAKNSDENFHLNANWLYANINVSQNFAAKLGRMQQPIHLFSSQLEAGYSLPWVRPPQEVYEQQFFNDYTGLELSWKSYIAGHDVAVKLLHGVQDNSLSAAVLGILFAKDEPQPEFLKSDNFVGLAVQFEGDFYRINLAGVKQDLSIGFPSEVMNGFKLDLGACGAGPVAMQAAGLTANQCGRLSQTVALLSGDTGGTEIYGDFWSIGVDAQKFGVRLVAEYALRNLGDFYREGYYVSLMRNVDKWTPYVTYAAHDNGGEDMLDPQAQQSIALGARYDWMANTALKFEVLNADPQDSTRGLYHIGFTNGKEMESMMAATVALDIVF